MYLHVSFFIVKIYSSIVPILQQKPKFQFDALLVKKIKNARSEQPFVIFEAWSGDGPGRQQQAKTIDLEGWMSSTGLERPSGTKKTKAARNAASSCSVQESTADFMKEVSSSSTRNDLKDQKNDERWTTLFEVQNKKFRLEATKTEAKKLKAQS